MSCQLIVSLIKPAAASGHLSVNTPHKRLQMSSSQWRMTNPGGEHHLQDICDAKGLEIDLQRISSGFLETCRHRITFTACFAHCTPQ